MSLLAPLYFAGALAIGLPILFHLIRRRPKGEIEFSSLMFLRPTPPRLTRKSRLDNWPLLLIRALALILLAAAFARPFLRSAALSEADLPSRRLVLLVDTSASMQRPGMWQQTLERAGAVIDDLLPADQLAIVSFDQKPKTQLGLEQSSQMTVTQRQKTARQVLAGLSPSWLPTDTGRALRHAADLAISYEADTQTASTPGDEPSPGSAPQSSHVILITDLQQGSRIESLQAYDWPEDLRLDVRRVVAAEKTNAFAQVLTPSDEDRESSDERVRVRVANSADAIDSAFRISWEGGSTDLPVQVPPGQSRVVRMPAAPPGTTELKLRGDQQSFDNTRYLVSPQPQSLRLLYLGNETEEPRDSLFFYLRRIPWDNARRTVTVERESLATLDQPLDPKTTPLVVVSEAIGGDSGETLRKYVEEGGRLLLVFDSKLGVGDAEASLDVVRSALAEDTPGTGEDTSGTDEDSDVSIGEAEVDDYVMFSQIDFTHPLFAAMADPQFNDFTKIRVWSHRRIEGLGENWQVLSRFDDGNVALAEREFGRGRLWLLTTGWQPTDSQLALSTKFIPLMFGLFDSTSGRRGSERYVVGRPIDLPPSATASLITPGGTKSSFKSADDSKVIDQPGIYRWTDGDLSREFAVNLDESESATAAMAETDLERFGVTLGKPLTTAQSEAQQRQLRDLELEGRQRLWQWLLVAALVLLGVETWWGGWISRGQPRAVESSLET